METIYHVLYYLNKFDFTDNVIDCDYEKLRCVKRILVKVFEDYKVPKLIVVLCIVDNLFIALAVGEVQDILIKTDTLRGNNFFFYWFQIFC